MTKMTAAAAAVCVMEKEGVQCAFGVPGAAINPLYAALRPRNEIKHFLARHVEGAAHMAEGYTRARPGNIRVCIGTSGPAGPDMITGLYSAWADSIPILSLPKTRFEHSHGVVRQGPDTRQCRRAVRPAVCRAHPSRAKRGSEPHCNRWRISRGFAEGARR